ncbi:MAG: PqqD family protein [Planctomycetota bacterium]|jgi:hypothetical protein
MDRKDSLKIREDGFVFDSATGSSYTVNDSAQTIISGFTRGHDTVCIARSLVEQYCIDQDMAERDVRDLKSQLKNFGYEK